MKILKKIFPIVLTCIFMFGGCGAGTGNSGSQSGNSGTNSGGQTGTEENDNENIIINNGSTPSPSKPQSPATEHLQTKNRLHKVKVTQTSRPFVVNGKSDYKVLVPSSKDTTIMTAANYFVKYIKIATGCQLPIESAENYTWNEQAKWIVFDRPELFAAAGLTMPTEDIGISGYYIKSKGDSVFIAVQDSFGYQRATLSLLDHIVGYEMYWDDTVVFEKTGETLPDMDIIESPDFAFYQESNSLAGDGRYGMGFNTSPWINVGGAAYHNSFKYLPKETYQEQYPEWYSINDQGAIQDGTQLCYNARGDQVKWQAMVSEVAQIVLAHADANPDFATITITQEDTHSWCGCDVCLQMKEDYNGSNVASAIKFVNAVDDIVQAELQRRAVADNTSVRKLNIVIFAYRQSEKPPVKKNADGSYVEMDATVKCNPNVGVYIAPITSNYQDSFYSNENEISRENIRGWSAICNNLYIWLYDTNFLNYFFPLNSWNSKIETYRFMKENNAYYMYSQSQYDNGAVTHFSRFKDYIDAKASFDVNVNYNELKEAFFKNYYGPAAEPMLEFFDSLQSYMEYLSVKYPAVIGGGYKENIGQSYLWPKKVLDGYLKFVEEGYKSIESLKESDPEKYEIYYEHILLESMFPRYALLSFYQGSYTTQQFKAMALSFRDDCARLGITRYEEQQSLNAIWNNWGL